jgi:hypothetical protein
MLTRARGDEQRMHFLTRDSPSTRTRRRRFRHVRGQIRRLARRLLRAAALRRALLAGGPLEDLTRYEESVFSQNGEDGILRAIFGRVGARTRYFVEFGVEDGTQCNTRYLAERRAWRGLLMDGGHEDPRRNLHREMVTAENVVGLFRKYGVPREFDLLSIDIDGNDYWVWQAIAQVWRPLVVVVEYNASEGPSVATSVPYDPAFRWSGTNYFGASLRAMAELGARHGYTLVTCDSNGVNAFFVVDEVVEGNFVRRPVEQLYREPRYHNGGGHPPDPSRRLRPV